MAGVDGLDTRPSALIFDNHLLITAGTNYKARTLFLDLKLNGAGLPILNWSKYNSRRDQLLRLSLQTLRVWWKHRFGAGVFTPATTAES